MGRQVGKSTTVAALALHTCLYSPGGLVLVIAPSQRQSRELFIKIHSFLTQLEPPEILEEETKLSLMLGNGSRAVVLPGDGRTIRGYSSPALILMDEAAFIADEVYDAAVPMLAASPEGRLILMSTPYVSSGFFYQSGTPPTAGSGLSTRPPTAGGSIRNGWRLAREKTR